MTRGAVGAAERSAVANAVRGSSLSLGRVSGPPSGNLGWLGREVARQAIEDSIRSNDIPQQSLDVARCLVLEFDGTGNYLANYCNTTITIAAFLQQSVDVGGLVQIGCNGCRLQPGQLAYYAPAGNIGPFVAVKSADFQEVSARSSEPQPRPAQSSGRPPVQQANVSNGDLKIRALQSSSSGRHASLVAEIENASPISVGLSVATRSIWSIARAEIFNECGGRYSQGPPYDTFSGITKDGANPTWIPPDGKATLTFRPDVLSGDICKLSHAIVDVYVFRPGIAGGQSQPIYIPLR